MCRRVCYGRCASHRFSPWARLTLCLAVLCAVAACGGRPGYHTSTHYKSSHDYPPPGPPDDPWGPYIREASGRFRVPETWIRRVMLQESGGKEDVISWAGAMGLMQVMPDTYDDLRGRYGLGDDPFDPHNNILAGTAYLREMYDRFGAPGFLAAYNAGPNRLDLYLNSGTPLPKETVTYVASIAPSLGSNTPLSGPLAVYAGPGGYRTHFASYRAAGCDPDAAYNPDHPCTPSRQPMVQPASYAVAASAPSPAASECDPDAAYDPRRPCSPASATVIQSAVMPSASGTSSLAASDCDPDAAYDPTRPCRSPPTAPAPSASSLSSPISSEPFARTPVSVSALPDLALRPHSSEGAGARRPVQETTADRLDFSSPVTAGAWGIQVGAFANLGTAQAAADSARTAAPDLLQAAKIELPPTTPFGGKVAFRARLVGLSLPIAIDACSRLRSRGLACVTVSPGKDTS